MDFVVRSFVQAGVALALATVLWGLHRGIARLRGREGEPWGRWLGLTRPTSPRLGLTLLAIFLAVGAAFAWLSHLIVPGHDALARRSPQFAISGLPWAELLVAAPAYAFVMTGFTEELIFRGLIAKRLIRRLGETAGNLVQAALFALLHVAIVFSAVPEPSPILVAFSAVFPGAVGWVLGWAMVRDGGSIFAPWLGHSAANLATVAAYLAIYPVPS